MNSGLLLNSVLDVFVCIQACKETFFQPHTSTEAFWFSYPADIHMTSDLQVEADCKTRFVDQKAPENRGP